MVTLIFITASWNVTKIMCSISAGWWKSILEFYRSTVSKVCTEAQAVGAVVRYCGLSLTLLLDIVIIPPNARIVTTCSSCHHFFSLWPFPCRRLYLRRRKCATSHFLCLSNKRFARFLFHQSVCLLLPLLLSPSLHCLTLSLSLSHSHSLSWTRIFSHFVLIGFMCVSMKHALVFFGFIFRQLHIASGYLSLLAYCNNHFLSFCRLKILQMIQRTFQQSCKSSLGLRVDMRVYLRTLTISTSPS